jgi:hypothetical protein
VPLVALIRTVSASRLCSLKRDNSQISLGPDGRGAVHSATTGNRWPLSNADCTFRWPGMDACPLAFYALPPLPFPRSYVSTLGMVSATGCFTLELVRAVLYLTLLPKNLRAYHTSNEGPVPRLVRLRAWNGFSDLVSWSIRGGHRWFEGPSKLPSANLPSGPHWHCARDMRPRTRTKLQNAGDSQVAAPGSSLEANFLFSGRFKRNPSCVRWSAVGI